MIKLKRVYEPVEEEDGVRILVERLWPRGMKKEDANITLWLKDIAPSPELRKWYGHDPDKWPEFKKRYRQELKENKEIVSELREKAKEHVITFVYAAKDEERNSALVLKEFLEKG